MFLRRAAALRLTCVVVMHAAGTAGAQSLPAAADSPAALAIASSASAPNLLELLRQALASDRPDMRLTAARIASIANLAPLVPDIAKALETEVDPRAAGVELRSLLDLGSAEALAASEAYVRRATGEPLGVYAMWLARTSPDTFAERIDALLTRAGIDGRHHLLPALDTAVRRLPALEPVLVRTWMSRAPEQWARLLDSPRVGGNASMIVEALRSGHDTVRLRTVWHVLGQHAAGMTLPSPVVTVAMPDRAVSAAERPTWEQFGRELMARVNGRSTPDRADWLRTVAAEGREELRAVWWLGILTRDELGAIRQALGIDFSSSPASAMAPALRTQLPPRPQVMRTAPVFVEGFIPAVLEATGCPLSPAHTYAAVRLTYRPDGRPASAHLDPSVSPECQAALRALIQVTVADDDHPRPGPNGEWILLFLGSGYRACVDGVAAGAPVRVEEAPTDLERPTLTRRVNPVYPASAKRERSLVVIETVINSRGCPSHAVVRRGLSTALDLAALTAVTQWRYTPPRFEGKPVDVVMPVNVQFDVQ
jgi:TonB family protein